MMLIIEKHFSLSNIWRPTPKTGDKEETLTVRGQIVYFKEVDWSGDNKHFKCYK